MLVECSGCRARYTAGPSTLQGAQGAKVRCRRCGEAIEIELPGSPPGTEEPESRPAVRNRRENYGKDAGEETGAPEPSLDNVYSLDRFRESRPRKLPVEGYDISGSIRPEPAVRLARQEPATESAEPVAVRKEENPLPPDRTALPSPDETPTPARPPKRRLRFLTGSSHSIQPGPSHIVLLYLMLLLLGGCGYLLVRLLSRVMNGGSG